jgi:regulator of replication initiation timing
METEVKTEVKQDKAVMQLEEICKEDEILRKENATLRDRINYLEERIAQTHGSVVTKQARPLGR